jgi:AAA family ATP:ADP antiporter
LPLRKELTISRYKGFLSDTPILAIIFIAFAAGFLLCGYEFIRSSSSSLYIEFYGADRLPYAMFAGAIFTAIFLYGYGWVLTFLGARRTLVLTSLFSSSIMLICYFAIRYKIGPASLITYAVRESYIVIVIEQYWSFINSTLKEGGAKKFNGPITGVGSLGAIAGGYMVGSWAKVIGTESLLLLAAVSLLPALICSDLAYRYGGEPKPSEKEQEPKSLALKLFVDSSYLRKLGLLIILTQLMSTVLDLRFSTLVGKAYPVTDERTAFFGMFYAGLNTTAGILQFIVAPILLSFVGLRFIHPAIPFIHILAAVTLIVKPSLFTGGLAYLLFKAFDYSIFRAGKEIFYIPLSYDSRYRAKEVIDSFVYRASKGGAAALISLARMLFGILPGIIYPFVALASAFGWLGTVIRLVSQHDKMVKQSKSE